MLLTKFKAQYSFYGYPWPNHSRNAYLMGSRLLFLTSTNKVVSFPLPESLEGMSVKPTDIGQNGLQYAVFSVQKKTILMGSKCGLVSRRSRIIGRDRTYQMKVFQDSKELISAMAELNQYVVVNRYDKLAEHNHLQLFSTNLKLLDSLQIKYEAQNGMIELISLFSKEKVTRGIGLNYLQHLKYFVVHRNKVSVLANVYVGSAENSGLVVINESLLAVTNYGRYVGVKFMIIH